MNLYYVCQNQSQKQECEGQYLWSPQKDKLGKNNKGYINMSLVKKGDIIFHGANQKTYAISIARTDCYLAQRPLDIRDSSDESIWMEEGYRIDSEYKILTIPVDMRNHFNWFKYNHKGEKSAFNINGVCKQIYLNLLDEGHAKYIINRALELNQDKHIEYFLKTISKELLSDDISEYHSNELNNISNIVDHIKSSGEKPKWKGKVTQQEFILLNSKKRKPKRCSKVAANALAIANYQYEYDHDESKTFYKKSGVKYTEPHHLIPISKYADFEYEDKKYINLDVEENIVSLCSYCHNLLHYGRSEDKKIILQKLYEERKAPLDSVGIRINSFQDLMKYYV